MINPGFRPPSATVVSAEPFSHGTGTLRCLQKEMATFRHWSVSLWRDPDDVSHCRILSPDKTEWRLISATLCRWRRCFVADQLWFMTRIREEEEYYAPVRLLKSSWNLPELFLKDSLFRPAISLLHRLKTVQAFSLQQQIKWRQLRYLLKLSVSLQQKDQSISKLTTF